MGKSIRRLDGPEKAQGKANYTYDIAPSGDALTGVCWARRTRMRGSSSIDLSAAEKLPGVKAVLALKDPAGEGANGKAFYQGDEVAAVAATTEEIAEDAIRLVKVDFEPLPVPRRRRRR